jgi:hypothetical protein
MNKDFKAHLLVLSPARGVVRNSGVMASTVRWSSVAEEKKRGEVPGGARGGKGGAARVSRVHAED